MSCIKYCRSSNMGNLQSTELVSVLLGGSINGATPIAGWFVMENATKKRMVEGYPQFRNLQICLLFEVIQRRFRLLLLKHPRHSLKIDRFKATVDPLFLISQEKGAGWRILKTCGVWRNGRKVCLRRLPLYATVDRGFRIESAINVGFHVGITIFWQNTYPLVI